MKLVLSADAINHPLTGIGYYSLVLLEGLEKKLEEESLYAWSMGRLCRPVDIIQRANKPALSADNSQTEATGSALSDLRSLAARSTALVKLYRLATNLGARATLRSFGRSDVFLSPNFLLAPFPGKKIVTIPDFSTLRFPEHHPKARVQLVNSAIRYALKHADGLITLSEEIRREACEDFGFPREKVFVTPLAARPIFRSRAREEVEKTLGNWNLGYKGYFLSANTIEPRKNIGLILDAYSEYANAVGHPNALPLVLAGHSGWKNEAIFEQIHALSRYLPVIYLGYVSDNTLAELLSGALATIYVSMYEGFGLPILESMQSGTAVICSNHGAMAEVAGGAALFVDTGSAHSIASALEKLHCDPILVDDLVKLGLDNAATFSWDSTVTGTYDIVSSVANADVCR